MNIPTLCTRNILAIAIIFCAGWNQAHATQRSSENAQSLIESAQSHGTQFEQKCLSNKRLLAGTIASSFVAGSSVYATVKYLMADSQVARAIVPPLIITTCSGTIFTGAVLHTMLNERANRPHNHDQNNV